MTSTTTFRSRVSRANLATSKRVLSKLGLTPGEAVNIFFAQVAARRAIPFPVAEPDSEYAQNEYGLTPDDVNAFNARVKTQIARERRAGTIREVKSLEDLIA